MSIRGTATGPAHGSSVAVAFVWLFVFALLTAAMVNGVYVEQRRRVDCQSLGGIYVSGGKSGNDFCARDGLIIKVYR